MSRLIQQIGDGCSKIHASLVISLARGLHLKAHPTDRSNGSSMLSRLQWQPSMQARVKAKQEAPTPASTHTREFVIKVSQLGHTRPNFFVGTSQVIFGTSQLFLWDVPTFFLGRPKRCVGTSQTFFGTLLITWLGLSRTFQFQFQFQLL